MRDNLRLSHNFGPNFFTDIFILLKWIAFTFELTYETIEIFQAFEMLEHLKEFDEATLKKYVLDKELGTGGWGTMFRYNLKPEFYETGD